ncbi:MAG: GntR family transcriptional regulator [Thermodesulfobacteriota bacterium]
MEVQFKTKTEIVHAKLHRDIIGGKLRPGQRIILSELAKEFGFSEIPIREAIRSLETAGLVRFTPHVGAVVSEFNDREFLEIYIIRIELEALATRLAVEHITDADLDFLDKNVVKTEMAIQQNKHAKIGPLNKEFHLRIYQAAPYPYLLNLIKSLWEKFELFQSVFAYVPDRAIPSCHEHRKIIEALRAKDGVLAEKLVKEQKERTIRALKERLDTR